MYNAIEKIVSDLYVDFERKHHLACHCQTCRNDILALVLNRIPPKYIATPKGELYIKALYLDPQLQSDIMRELSNAALIVEQNRHHA